MSLRLDLSVLLARRSVCGSSLLDPVENMRGTKQVVSRCIRFLRGVHEVMPSSETSASRLKNGRAAEVFSGVSPAKERKG